MLLKASAAQLSRQLGVFLLNIVWRRLHSGAAIPRGLSPPDGQSPMSSSNFSWVTAVPQEPLPTEPKGQQAAVLSACYRRLL